jgi:hypothetical protein
MEKKKIESFDTIMVTAHEWGWDYVLLEKNMWYIQRLANKNINKIKYIAFYQTAPICAITSYAKVKKITYNWELSHYDVHLSGKPIFIKPIKLDSNKRHLAPQSTKYTLLKRLLKAKKISDLIDK